MQCPHCGNELSGEMPCSKCGRKVSLKGDIEVEYKEFKVSEFLEIRKSQQESRAEGTSEPGTEQKGGPLSQQSPANSIEKPTGRRTKRLLITFLLILIFFGLVAGAYYFLRFLF